MGFSSKLYPGEPIIDDSTTEGQLMDMTPKEYRDGLQMPEGRMSIDYAYGGLAKPFPESLLIPESEWEPRVKEMEERKTRISDLVAQAGLPHKDQDRTNYCWINAPVYCSEVERVVQNQEMVILSPASCGAPIKGFRNVGGWGKEGLLYIVANGIVPVEFWPANAIDRRYYTPENREIAKKYRILEWFEAKPRNFAEHFSLLLRRKACAVGLNYWRHEVSDEDPVFLDGEPCVRFRNSWRGYGVNGYGIRRGSKKYADDIVCPTSVTAA